MGVGFGEDELWQFLEDSHTGILTTLRADGWPVALPVWFTVRDHRVYVQTPARTRKVAHVRRDPRVCFTAEAGVAWAELRAVVLTGLAGVVPDGEEKDLAMALISEKYRGFGLSAEEVPAVTVQYYDTPPAVIRVDPDTRRVSWDNRKLRLRSDAPGS
jgi:PPOX class probable F420-dependent enzyme